MRQAVNKPTRFTKGSTEVRFAYNAARNRFLKQTAAATTHYLDKLYERSFETDDQGQPVTKSRHFIYVGGNEIAVHTKTEGSVGLIAAQTAFMHHDALGSVDMDTIRDLARADVFDYIESFYNRIRSHSHLGGVSPEAFEGASK